MPNKPYSWGHKHNRIIFFPGTAALGLSLYAVPNAPIGIFALIVSILAIASALVGVASAVAPYLPEILHERSHSAIRRAARKGWIGISEAIDLIQADTFPSKDWPGPTALVPPEDCHAP